MAQSLEKLVLKTLKSKEEAKKLMKGTYGSSGSRAQKPFRGGPPSNIRRGGGRDYVWVNKSQENLKYGGGRHQGQRGNFESNTSTSLQHYSRSRTCKYKKCTPINKTVVLTKNTRGTSGRKTVTFSRKLGKADKRSKHFGNSAGIQNTLSRSTNSKSVASFTHNEPDSNMSSKHRDPRNVEERCGTNSIQCSRAVSQQSLSSKKERWWKPSCDKSKGIKLFHPLPSFQDGGATFAKRDAAGKRFHVQIGPKGCILLHTYGEEFKEICSFSMAREPLRVFMPMFWFGPSTFNIHKTYENSNSYPQKNQHSHDRFLGRYVNHGEIQGGNYIQPKHYNFSPAASRFCDKPKEITDDTCPGNRVSRSENKLSLHDSFSTRGQNTEHNNSMLQSITNTSDHIVGTHKSHRTPLIHSTSSATRGGCNFGTCRDNKISILVQKKSYQTVLTLNKQSLEELVWWKENLTFQNGKSLRILQPDLIIQTDASKKGWGHFVKEYQQGDPGP